MLVFVELQIIAQSDHGLCAEMGIKARIRRILSITAFREVVNVKLDAGRVDSMWWNRATKWLWVALWAGVVPILLIVSFFREYFFI